MKKKIFNNDKNKGITLIALVVTIVVLLILAGTSISMLTGENGIINQAQTAQIENNHSSVFEAMQLEVQSFKTNKIVGEISTDALSFLKNEGKIDENNIVNVKDTLQKKLSTGNGSGKKDVYAIEENDYGEYELIYYDKNQTPRNLGTLINKENETEYEKYFNITEDGIVSIKKENSGYYDGYYGGYYGETNIELDLEELIVPSKINGIEVKELANNFLAGNTKIKRVKLSKGISVIGFDAFGGCSNLTNIIIPESVTDIEAFAFSGCTNLADIKLPSNIEKLGFKVFDETKFWNDIPDGDVYFGKMYYTYKGKIPSGTTIKIKEGTLMICEGAFYECEDLEKIEIPNSVIKIGYNAFTSCANLKDVKMSENLESIGFNNFLGSEFFDNLPDGDVYFGKVYYMYKGEMPSGTTVKIKEGTLCISDGAFMECKGLEQIEIPNSVVTIEGYVFAGCANLNNITIPNSVINMGSYVFENWTSNQTINIQFKENKIPTGWNDVWNLYCSANIKYLDS